MSEALKAENETCSEALRKRPGGARGPDAVAEAEACLEEAKDDRAALQEENAQPTTPLRSRSRSRKGRRLQAAAAAAAAAAREEDGGGAEDSAGKEQDNQERKVTAAAAAAARRRRRQRHAAAPRRGGRRARSRPCFGRRRQYSARARSQHRSETRRRPRSTSH